jgi:hypothetical protein
MMILDIANLKKRHDAYLKKLGTALIEEAEGAAEEIRNHVRAKPGFTHRTHNAEKRTRGKVMRVGGKLLVIGTNDASYARVLEGGSKAHTITARNGGRLRFIGRDGTPVYRRSVRHPGTKPYRFLSRAVTHASRVFGLTFSSRLRSISL